MGAKKGKDVIDENYWRTSIENTPLDEEKWNVKVIIMEAAGSDQDRIYLNKFETFAAEEKRFVVKSICKTETIFMVNQLGGEKKVKDDNLRVFEEGQAFLKDKKDIPSDILALIIKHLILKMKEEYLFIKRQKLEVREGMRRESATMFDGAEVRNTVNLKPTESLVPPTVPKGRGKKTESENSPQLPEPDEGKKYNTLLRVRGEEWRDKVYVDDFPTDGPNLYVAITGFVEPLLPECLIKIGVPLAAVVQIRINPTSVKVPSSLFRATKRGQSQTDILSQKSHKFWDDLQNLRIDKNSTDSFKNTAFIVFSPPYWATESLSGSPDKIYDEFCYLMYDIQDLTRQHIHYLENMDVISIPIELEHKQFMKYYYQLIDDLPLECVTIYSILDSVLQTICKMQNLDEESSLSTAVTINQDQQNVMEENNLEKSETLIHKIFNTLCKTDTDKRTYRITYGDEYENHKDPIIIHYGDYAKYNTFHLGNINLDNIVWSMLVDMPINRLWQNKVQPFGELEAKINFHVNVLLSCFDRDDIETVELNRLLHILACRKLFNNRSSLKKHHLSPSTILEFKKVYLKCSVLAEPFQKCPSLIRTSSSASHSFPSISKIENESDVSSKDDLETLRIKFLIDCPDISELVSAAEISSEKPINHMIDEFDFFEDFTGINSFQVMLNAFNEFNCVDYKYCEVTDCFILMFFNNHDKEGISREEWRCHVPTPLCLQDFFDFVLEEHYDWIQNEEKIYDKKIISKSQSVCKDLIDPFAEKSCVENTEDIVELLMEGSLKYQEIALMEERSPEATESKTVPSKKSTISPSSTDLDSKSSKKAKSPTITSKNVRQSMSLFGPDSAMSIEVPKKPFSGYDLSDRRVEVFGKDALYFSNDGTRISSMYTLIIPMNLEYIVLNLKLGNENNEFWVHRALGNNVKADIRDTCESFRISSKDQVTMYIKKESYQIPFQATNCSANNLPQNRKESLLKPSSAHSRTFLPPIFETKTFHSLYVTWPNGLITQTVHDNGSHNISHIKQYHMNHVLDLNEDIRCISLNGEVIIFKTSKDIEVLRPDGSYIKINKYDKRTICSDIIEDAHTETSSDKSKKAKGKEKDKSKEKSNKASSKSSKSSPSEDDQIEAKPEPCQVLHIQEFEIIETSGQRQKWINDNVFDIEQLLIRTATDFCLGEIFSRRMDGTNILLNKEGTQIVTFPNKTRIITNFIIENEEIYPEWTEDEKEYFFRVDFVETDTFKSTISISQKSYIGAHGSVASSVSKKIEEEEETAEKERTDGYVSVQIIYTIEHPNFTTITINKADGKVIVDSLNNTSVIIDNKNVYELKLDSVTSAKFDGKDLRINYETCTECKSSTHCKIRIRADEFESSVSKIHQNWLNMRDSFCKHIVVNEEGSILVADEEMHAEEFIENIEEKSTDIKSENSVNSHGKCKEMYRAKDVRFFILRRDLTCSEVIHRALIDQYKRTCRWQPWCSINQHDTFGDHRSLHSLLTPVNLTESEKWLMDSKLAGKPKYLAYKDLKKDVGKGFYHWMRPYERFEPKPMKPENVLPPRLPRAFILRTLEQQWSEAEREELKGAKELLKAILRYRRIMESDSETILNVPILDPRPEDERRIDDIIQALAHRIYENLKIRLAEDVQSRAKATVTTKPPPIPEEMSVEMELEEEATEDVNMIEKQRESLVQELDDVEKMSPDLKRYWRRRAEEYKEEQFYKYLLREGSVPPYFRNVLGGAIWWEMNSTASEAVTKAELRKMKCVCAAEEATTHTNT